MSRHPVVSRPEPFVRNICGPGNSVAVRYDPASEQLVLTRAQLRLWECPLTAGAFRRAVRSIARERAAASTYHGTVLVVVALDGTELYRTRSG